MDEVEAGDVADEVLPPEVGSFVPEEEAVDDDDVDCTIWADEVEAEVVPLEVTDLVPGEVPVDDDVVCAV